MHAFYVKRCIIRRPFMVIAAIAASVLFAALGDALAVDLPANLQIMPLGDSITRGSGGTNAGYRGRLYSLLSPIASNVQCVGASTNNNPSSLPANGRHHNGYSSYNTLNISNNLDGVDTSVYDAATGDARASRDPYGGYWLTGGHGTGRDAVYPDVILLMVGTNDTSPNGGDPESFQDRLDSLVNKIVTLRPDTRLIMADITPFPTRVATVTEIINPAVNAVAAKYLALNNHVSVVDLYTSFPSDGLTSDGAHPNNTGYNWMANQWYGAIVKSYATPTPEPGTFVMLAVGLLGLLAYARRKRRN